MISPDLAGAFVVEVGVSLRPMGLCEVPELTARVARTAFPSGTAAMRVRDALCPIPPDDLFRDAFPSRGKPALSPALVSVLPFAEPGSTAALMDEPARPTSQPSAPSPDDEHPTAAGRRVCGATLLRPGGDGIRWRGRA